jgi:hypothetical protein
VGEQTRRHKAFHEAGHVVLARLHRRGPTCASIDATNDMEGFARMTPIGPKMRAAIDHDEPLTRRQQRWTEDMIKILLGGILAERIALRSSHLSTDDLRKAGALEARAQGIRPLEVLLVEAEQELRLRWSAVARVADALMVEATLNRNQIRSLVDRPGDKSL